MFLGFCKLEDTLLISNLCKASEAPANPDAAPAYRIYGLVSGSVALMTNGTGTLSATDSQTGFTTGTKTITGGDGYVTGQTYVVKVTYAVSSAQKGDIHTFTVF